MLSRLVIQNVVLIDKLSIALEKGLNVFTGETGAGKSIVLDALGLALGARGDASLVRSGSSQAIVSAELSGSLPSALTAILEENGLDSGTPLLLRRVMTADGKSRAFVNDQPVSAGLLRRIGGELLEIHGQFESHGLLDPSIHRSLLDEFSGHAELKRDVALAFAEWKKAAAVHAEAADVAERSGKEEDFLRAAVTELDDLAPEKGETERLAERRAGLQHREKILSALQAAEQAIDGEHGVISSLAAAGKALARVADKTAELGEILSMIDAAAEDISAIGKKLAGFACSMEAEPEALRLIEDRLFALRAAARKHGVPDAELPQVHNELKKRLALLEDRRESTAGLAMAAETARSRYIKLAEELSIKRKKAAETLIRSVECELPPLKLENARFIVEVKPLPEEHWSAEGMDRVSFSACANPGTQPGPLQKAASGGELARFMLAIKVALAKAAPVPVLVFDEVDAGIGGATASAVGERLAKLAGNVQILAVTHSPQVAARGSHHVRVWKSLKSGQAVTVAETLDAQARVEEIARMLSGSRITDAARKAAASLLNDTSPVPRGATAWRARRAAG